MTPTPKTLGLFVLVVVLAAFNALGGRVETAESLPELSGVPVNQVVRLDISTPIQKMTIEREGEGWRIVTPLQFPADAAQIRSVLKTFEDGVAMEALVDEGNHEDYGVDDQNGLLVELFTANAEVPAVSVVVGKPAAGPSSFVRIPGSEAVYRADVGGRGRYERPAADWRDRMALDLDRAKVVAFTLERGDETLRFRRGPTELGEGGETDGKPTPGAWALEGAPFPIDDDGTEAVVRALTKVRAGEIHNPDYEAGFATPRARATLELEDGATHVLVLGAREADGAAFVRVDDRPEVFRTSASVARAMTQPLEAFRDRALLSFERADVASVTLEDGGLTLVLAQSDDGTSWQITQPANMDADQKLALFTVNTLATLRASGAAADEVFTPSGTRFVVRFRDGRTQTLELGQTELDADQRPLVRVRASGRPGVWLLKQATVTDLKRVFGRG